MREGLWVLWAMKNKSLTKRTGGRRAVGGVGNEKYKSHKIIRGKACGWCGL